MTSVGTPKAGVFSEGAARVVAEAIIADQQGGEQPGAYTGMGSCYVEFGQGRVARVDVDFLSGPAPTGSFQEPSVALAEEALWRQPPGPLVRTVAEKTTMYVRTIKNHILPGKLDEFARLWQEFWSAPHAQAAFVGTAVYWGVDRAANTAVSICVWEEHPDEIPAYKALVRAFSPRAQQYLSCAPTVDTYEVVRQR